MAELQVKRERERIARPGELRCGRIELNEYVTAKTRPGSLNLANCNGPIQPRNAGDRTGDAGARVRSSTTRVHGLAHNYGGHDRKKKRADAPVC
jgi:hypothetical protein